MKHRSYLRRLDRAFYQGDAIVHWSMTIQNRATGWLVRQFHLQFREWLTHALFLQKSACAVYTLMPDHIHMLILGLALQSDQLRLLAFLRRQVNSGLNRVYGEYQLQKQPYDHVLKEKEKEKGAFQSVALYVAENPVRAGLVKHADDYPYTEALVLGYPEISFRQDDFWERF